MTKIKFFPTVSRPLRSNAIHVNRAGNFMLTSDSVKAMELNLFEPADLLSNGMAYEYPGDAYFLAHEYNLKSRSYISSELNYFIIIPTLRCNLSCTYCQVSRADEKARGFDWNEEQYDQFLDFFNKHAGSEPKIEIQGGEPTLIFSKLKTFLQKLYSVRPKTQVVICTNLQDLPERFFEDVQKLDLQISSSLDGNFDIHNANRNQNQKSSETFFQNVEICLEKLGKERLSFLTTISNFDDIAGALEAYRKLGLDDVYLRPVNYQGFARKRHSQSKENAEDWFEKYIAALDLMFQSNDNEDHKIRETNFALHAKRIFSNSFNSHVDFRNPNPVAKDYVVINFDGTFFPSDEARMLHRIGLIDLSIGSLDCGFDYDKIVELDRHAQLENYADCNACAYKPFCGIDIIDLISKNGTVDIKMSETEHCKAHIKMFDYIFSKLADRDETFLRNLNFNISGSYSIPHFVAGRVYD